MGVRISASTKSVIAWICAVLLAYGAMNARVAVLEDRVDTYKADIVEIKADIKKLLERVR